MTSSHFVKNHFKNLSKIVQSFGMDDPSTNNSIAISSKIARLVEEKGWNQERFAREAGLNRQTVRQILQEGTRTLRNSTIGACSRALGITVNDLRILSLERLLDKMSTKGNEQGAPGNLLERATQPELIAWIERNPERAADLTGDEADELLDLQQESGGHLSTFGVEHVVQAIERKRRMIEKLHTISGTEYVDLTEQLIDLIYEKVQPYRDRA